LLVTVNLSSKDSSLPSEALSAIDAALAVKGFRKQVRSVVVPGKEYATTYDGPTINKEQVDDIMLTVAERHHITYKVDVEESVSFP